MRKPSLVLLPLVLALLAQGAWIGYRAVRQHRQHALALAGVPPRPNTSRWSKRLVEHIDQATVEVSHSRHPERALGDLARMYQANGYTAEAATALRALRQLEPDNPRWTYYLADLRLKANDQKEAIELLRETVRLAPDYVPALILLGDLLIRQHQPAEARTYFESCLVFAPADPRGPANLAYLDSLAGDLRGALDRLDTLLRKYPNYGAGHHLKSELLAKAGDRVGAAEERKRESICPPFVAKDPWITELNNDCYDGYRLQMAAAALAKAGQIEEALPLLRRSVEISPDEATFYDTLSEAETMAGRLDDARATLEKAVAAVPDAFILPVHLAVVLCRQQRADEALAVVDRALKKWPDQAEVMAARGHALLIAQRPAEAVEAFRAALARNNGMPEAHFSLGRGLLLLGRTEEAKVSFGEALQIRPNYGDALVALANLAIEAGELGKAEEYATRAFTLAPHDASSRRALADVHHQKANEFARVGQMDEAEKAYRAAIELDPGNPLLHAGLGMVYVTTHRLEIALPELRLFAAGAPNEPQAYSLLGHTLLDLQRKAEAREVVEKGLAVAKKSGNTEDTAEFQRLLQSL